MITTSKLFRKIKSVVPLLQSQSERRHELVGPADLWKMKRDFQIAFLKNMGLKPEHYLLDVGCGTLRGGIPIIEYLQECHYYGIDARENVLLEGRKELHEANLDWKNPVLIASSDVQKVELSRKFEFIWAFSVLFHMTDAILVDTLSLVGKHLAADGVFYANVNIGVKSEKQWQGFPVVWRTSEFYNNVCAQSGLSVSDLGPIRELGHISNAGAQDQQHMLKVTLL